MSGEQSNSLEPSGKAVAEVKPLLGDLVAGAPYIEGRLVWVVGMCPACENSSLFVGAGGYLTCAWLPCTNPCAASDALAPPTTAQTPPESPGSESEFVAEGLSVGE